MKRTHPKCETCRWWVHPEWYAIGECRRMPPQVVQKATRVHQGAGYWPQVGDQEWCGEHSELMDPIYLVGPDGIHKMERRPPEEDSDA